MNCSRRGFLKKSGYALSATIGAQAFAEKQSRPSRQTQPNIIFILTDQQSATMMSCAGNKSVKTPAMDRLAAGGMRFEKTYAANPVCLPNRFSFQTGRMPGSVKIGINEDGRKAVIPDSFCSQSMGPLLKRAGYETAYGGKTHLPPSLIPQRNGYNFFTRNSRNELADDCAEFIRKSHKKPFFLFASFINPHDICYMAINAYLRTKGKPPIGNVDSKTLEGLLDKIRTDGRYKEDDLNNFVEQNCPALPDNFEIPENEPECITTRYTAIRPFRKYVRDNWTEQMWRLHRWAYCRLTEMVDEKIGKLLDAVNEAGIEKNTVIIFTSDHGDMDSAHRLEHKSILYEEAVNVPFIMSLKGEIPAGTVNQSHLISNGLDLLPTVCDYAGIKPPRDLEGRSIRPVAEGRKTTWRDCVFVESQNGRMARTERFKYNIYDSGKNREQLIDLNNDPGEMKNLASDPQYKGILKKHRKLLSDWVKKTKDPVGVKYVIS